MKKQIAVWLIVFGLFLTGCAVQGNGSALPPELTPVDPQETQPVTEPPQPTKTPIPSIEERITLTPGTGGALTIEEHPMRARETVEGVLAVYADADWNTHLSRPYEVQIGEDLITFQEIVVPGEEGEHAFLQHVEVAIFNNEEPLMTLPIGTLRASSIVYGIYSDDASWYLEVDLGEAFYNEDGELEIPVLGDIYRDGISLNEAEGYDESFGFHIINGRPFYFFSRNGGYGYSFDGVEYLLSYTNITHHLCCGGSMASPRGSEDRVAFFAERGDQMYLVILGD